MKIVTRWRPMRAVLRALDRVLLGPIMSLGALIIERRLVGAVKRRGIDERGSDARATGDGTGRSPARR